MISTNVGNAPRMHADVGAALDLMNRSIVESQNIYSRKRSNPSIQSEHFHWQAQHFLDGIRSLVEMSDLNRAGFEKIEQLFKSFLKISIQWGIESEQTKNYESAIESLREKTPVPREAVLPHFQFPQMNSNLMIGPEERDQNLPLYKIKHKFTESIQKIGEILRQLDIEAPTDQQRDLIWLKKRGIVNKIKRLSSKLNNTTPEDRINELTYCLSKVFDELIHRQNNGSLRPTDQFFIKAFPKLVRFLRAHEEKLARTSQSVSPSPSLAEEVRGTIPVTEPIFPQIEEVAPVSSSSAQTEEAHVLEEPSERRVSARKRTASARLREEEVAGPRPKRQKSAAKALKMPFLTPDSIGEPKSLDEVVNSLKVEGERTQKLYIPANLYTAFYEQFTGGKKGWADHFKKNPRLNSPENRKLKAKYDAYKAQSLEERSKNFRIRQSEDHPVFGHMLFTTKEILKGEIVGEYRGHLVSKGTGETENNRYLFDFNSEDPQVNDYVIDGAAMCNEMAFVVHNDAKRCNTEIKLYFDEEGPHILIVAKKKIAAGSPPSINYGPGYWAVMGFEPLCLDY